MLAKHAPCPPQVPIGIGFLVLFHGIANVELETGEDRCRGPQNSPVKTRCKATWYCLFACLRFCDHIQPIRRSQKRSGNAIEIVLVFEPESKKCRLMPLDGFEISAL